MVEPVRPIALSDIEDARGRIAGTALRTPLVRLDAGRGAPEIFLKLENLQPTNAYKIRGATNAVARLSEEQRARGVWTISAGNAGQGVAYAARAAGIACSVVAIETAPQTKLERMRALGATIIPVTYTRGVESGRGPRFRRARRHLHPPVRRSRFHRRPRDHGAGNPRGRARRAHGDRRDRRRRADHRRRQRHQGAPPRRARSSARSRRRPRLTLTRWREGGPRKFPDWQASFVDGAGGQSVTPRMWERMKPMVDGAIIVVARPGARGDAADGGKGAGDRRGRRRACRLPRR